MKRLVILFVPTGSPFVFTKELTGSQSALDVCISWAAHCALEGESVLLCFECDMEAVRQAVGDGVRLVVRDKWSLADVLDQMAHLACEGGYESVVFSLADRPLINGRLTDALIEHHKRYVAEYTFADGYPEGLAPQVINAGTLSILANLARGQHKDARDAPFKAGSIWQLLQRDINSFEVESLLAPKDWRPLRLDFSCYSKRGFLACKRLADEAAAGSVELLADSLSALAAGSVCVQRTVPAFYDVQISSNCSSIAMYDPYPVEFKRVHGILPVPKENPAPHDMSLDEFAFLMDQVEELSDDAVVSLGSMGEPLLREDFPRFVEVALCHKRLRVLVETDGTRVTEQLADEVASAVRRVGARALGEDAITWIVSLDAVDEAMYESVRRGGSFSRAVSAVSMLHSRFPGGVYPQFTRMRENEGQLETFYRYWSDKASPSGGKVIIQKYDHCCHVLPERKSADLTPLVRLPCWHIKRDMTVMADGGVPVCREFMMESVGNALTDGLSSVWDKLLPLAEDHVNGSYPEKCKVCDEYYTFNF